MKSQKRSRKVKQATSAPPPDIKPESTPSVEVVQRVLAPPEVVLQEAMAEPDRRLLEEYAEAIRVLREGKRFSFREIAEWLQEYGIECDHNSVYREYTKGLSDEEEREVALRDAEEENERP